VPRVVAGWPAGAFATRRRRRRLGAAAAALVLGALAVGAVLIGDTAPDDLPLTDRPNIVVQNRPAVRLSAPDRKAILETARQFVLTGVQRKHPEQAWFLASSALRAGTTRAEWKAGTLPLPPYPVSRARWNFAYAVAGEVGLDVYVESSDPEIRPLTHRLTLVRNKRATRPRWLVDGWTAMSVASGGYIGSSSPAEEAAAAFSSDPAESPTPKPSAVWLLTPLVILSLAFLAPLVIVFRSRRAERRVRRRKLAR
jgi:hypothetical protein